MDNKLMSRKFWIAVAAFLASLGTGITGLATDNEAIAMTGGILCVVSASIYAFCEAYVDGASIKSESSQYIESVQVQSTKGDQLIEAAAAKLQANTSSIQQQVVTETKPTDKDDSPEKFE